MIRVRWAVFLMSLAVVVAGCREEKGHPGRQEGLTANHDEIVGATAVEAPDADGSDLTTESIAGTVARVGWGCSGVLIGRQTVLTAAHCGDATGVQFAQSPREFAVDFVERHDDWSGRAPDYDLAIVHLRDPVPPDIVRNVAPLFLGEFQAASWEGTRGSGFEGLVVGYGRHNNCIQGSCEGQDTGAGVRRFGRVTGLRAWGKYLKNSLIDYDREVAINKGDSGGPLFLKDETSGRFYVVGINSYLWWGRLDDEGFGPIIASAWAMTGSSRWLGGLDTTHPSWLSARLGPDADGDGVLDSLDNCPPWRCIQRGLPLEACANPDQLDEDGDLVGDVCDNCPPSACTALGDGRSCTNALQLDFDGDGVGDVCDPCSSNTRFDRNQISNGGTVGDGCNRCRPRTAQHFMRCEFGSTTCEDAKAGRCLSDFDVLGQPLQGWCSELADFDGDRIPDVCDVCPLEPDGAQGNLNSHIEEETGSARQGDVCDPVPAVRFSQVVPTFETIDGARVLPRQALEVGTELQDFEIGSWLGRDETLLADTFTQNVSLRHCSCWDEDGIELPLERCQKWQCLPSQAELMSDGAWKRMTLTLDIQGPDLPPSGIPLKFVAGESAEGTSVVWRLHKDVEAQGDNRIESKKKVTTHGLVASVVERKGGVIYASPRDQGTPLRVVVDMVDTPKAFYKDRRFVPRGCLLPSCLGWVRPWEKYWNPPRDIRSIARFPFLVGPITSFDAWLGHDERLMDIGDLVAPRLVQAMESGEWAWISYSEPSRLVESLGLEVQALLVPRDGAAVAPMPVGIHKGLLDLLIESTTPVPGEGPFSLSRGGRAAFSAVQQALYVADEAQGDAILRYDLNSGRSELVAGTTLEYVGPVLGLALDASRNRLFVLQKLDAEAVASLTLHDLRRGDRTTLLTVPYSGAFESTTLAVDSSGAVILGRGDASQVTLWRYEVAESAKLIFTGSRADAGQLADTPLSGDLTVPLLRGQSELSLLQPDAASFAGGQPCAGL